MTFDQALQVFSWAHANALALAGFAFAGVLALLLSATYYDLGPR